MPVTHEYPRYTADSRFGLTASPRCNILVVSDPVTRHRPLVIAGAAEDAIAWNPVTGQAARKFREEDDEDFADEEAARPRLRAGAVVARLAWHAGASTLAVGYSDGWIRLYNLWTGELLVKFCGHKNAVSTMAFNSDGSLLAAGGMDSDVTLLRIEGESGFRLQGHTNSVTRVEFLEKFSDCLLTASKDGLMKFWNLELRVCFKTLTGHPGEVWDFALIGSAKDLLVTGSCDNQLRLWRLSVQQQPEPPAKRPQAETDVQGNQLQPADLEDALSAEFLGSVTKTAKFRTHSLSVTAGGSLICVASGARGLEWFACLSSAEQRTRLRQRQKKAARKSAAGQPGRMKLSAEDLLKPAGMLTGFPAKLRWAVPGAMRLAEPAAASIADGDDDDEAAGTKSSAEEGLRFECFVSLDNNSVLSYHLLYSKGAVSVESLGSRISQGHEGPVRCAAVSSDGLAVMTLSAGQLKLWRFSSLACLLTIACPDSSGSDEQRNGQMTKCVFLPGDRYAAVGTADGRILLCDLSDGRVAEQLQAHTGPVTCLRQLSDASGLVSGSSAERQAMQWRYEIARAASTAVGHSGLSSRLGLLLSRSIALDDGLASVCNTPDSRLLCCGLLDNSIRVFFTDSVRQFLHLHGHSQPAVSLAVSADSALLASGSGDRTIRLWGLQFGDCQKILRGHDLAITDLQFVPLLPDVSANLKTSSRLLVSSGSDKCLRLWDAAKFRRVAALYGHQAAVSCVAVSPNGDYLASVDADGSVRTWQRCEEPLVLEEQRELEKDAQFEEEMAEQQAEATDSAASGLVSRLSLQSVRGAEELLAALERWESDCEHQKSKTVQTVATQPQQQPLESLAGWLGKQPLHELEQAISALPAVHAKRLLTALDSLAAGGLQPERVCRCACLLLSFHFPCLAVTSATDSRLQFQSRLTACGSGLADMLGFNLAALRLLQSMAAELTEGSPLTDNEEAGRRRQQQRKKRQKQVFDLRTH